MNVKSAHIYSFTVRPDSSRPYRDWLNKTKTFFIMLYDNCQKSNKQTIVSYTDDDV